MKPTMKPAAVLTAALLMTGVIAVTPVFSQKSDVRSRGIQMQYDKAQVDGVRIVVLKGEGNNWVPVDPSRQFKQGEQIKIAFESNFSGYVYIVNVAPNGKKLVLFPNLNTRDNKLVPLQRYELPTRGVMEFDKETGIEILQVILSPDPIQFYDDAVRNSQGELGASAKNAAAELSASSKRGGIAENVAVAAPPQGVRTRGLKLAPGKNKDDKGSTLIASPDKTGSGKLGKGEIAVCELRLQHI